MGKLTFYKKTLAFCKIPWYYLTCVSGCGSAWLERRLREAEVASSNPATPILKSLIFRDFIFLHMNRNMNMEPSRSGTNGAYFGNLEDYTPSTKLHRGVFQEFGRLYPATRIPTGRILGIWKIIPRYTDTNRAYFKK